MSSNKLFQNKRSARSTRVVGVLLEQYKLYVEMADRISERRDKANAFFLTLNTLAVTVMGFYWEKHLLIQPRWLLTFPLLAQLAFCWFWWRLIKSYRQLNAVKFQLIGDLEYALPVPLWSTEWLRLGQGKDFSKYAPLSELEEKVPVVFVVIYAIATLIVFVG